MKKLFVLIIALFLTGGGAVFDTNGCLVGILIAGDGSTEDGVMVRNLVEPINDIRETL